MTAMVESGAAVDEDVKAAPVAKSVSAVPQLVRVHLMMDAHASLAIPPYILIICSNASKPVRASNKKL